MFYYIVALLIPLTFLNDPKTMSRYPPSTWKGATSTIYFPYLPISFKKKKETPWC